jgi:hypothetical protein
MRLKFSILVNRIIEYHRILLTELNRPFPRSGTALILTMNASYEFCFMQSIADYIENRMQFNIINSGFFQHILYIRNIIG